MKLFMTGATGYVGRHILQHLLNKGHQVLALTRKTPNFEHTNLTWIYGALETPEFYESFLCNVDAIVHLAMEYPGSGDRSIPDKIATRTFINSGKFILYTGNLYTSYQTGETIHEELLPAGHYWWNDHETLILGAKQPSAVIRLGFVYGGTGGYLWPGLSADENGRILYTGNFENHWPFVHVEDVARLYEMVLTKQASGIFHAVDNTPITIGEIFEKVTQLQGGKPLKVAHYKAKKRLGGFADHMLKDIIVSKERSTELGWRPVYESFLISADLSFEMYQQAQKKISSLL